VRNRISGSDSGYEEAHMLCGAGGMWAKAPRGGTEGGGGGVERGQPWGEEEREQDAVRGEGKRRFSRRCCRAVDEVRTRKAVEFEERQTGVGLPVGSSARVEDGQKKGGARG